MAKSLWTCHKPIKFSIGKKLFTVRQCLMSDNNKSSWDLLLDFSIWEQGYLKPGNDFNPLSTIKITNRSWTHRTNICHGTLICLWVLGAEKKKINTGAWKCHCNIYICLFGTTTYLWLTYMSFGIQRVNWKLFILH